MNPLIADLIWDPSPYLFEINLPFLGRPLLWYGLFFAIGFFLGYKILSTLVEKESSKDPLLLHPSFEKKASRFVEKLSFFVIVGGLIGARLGDLLFYQGIGTLISHPMQLIAFWEGGLASHGGAIGILCSLALFMRKYRVNLFRLIDLVAIPVSLAAVCIRIGNFFNQEVLGTPTDLPWGILFLHPADGSSLVPRHPAQLYEGVAYLLIFAILVWKRDFIKTTGKMAGLFLVLVFTARFAIEFVKVEQSIYTISFLNVGQLLSLPFIGLGIWLLRSYTKLKLAL